eukprot:CAMPEP_0177616496 /NCGR_PEP_ID=MMETSP0419_2-20121207/24197_1 /TAXON_ID=582737 /ORGANISM="Tetraselmis sp., Strain GSL018" /LENGTH=490 /DNA_ID=CAMNT_0019114579 /DNA_START=53 /DNA_END=1522 /DNA_ORIENTATION=+
MEKENEVAKQREKRTTQQVVGWIPAVMLPASLSTKQRAAVHEAAENAGLLHRSEGNVGARRLALGTATGGSPTNVFLDDGLWTDQRLAAELLRLLGLDVSAELQNAPYPDTSALKNEKKIEQAKFRKTELSLGKWIETTGQLLEGEKLAEIAEAKESVCAKSSTACAASGRTLLNLKCQDVETGLLGRSILTLVPNWGPREGRSEALPPHKFGPHDVVALRPNKGDSTAEALAEGLVYRVKDAAILVAVDEAPEEGLDRPLRLEKLANEVTYRRYRQTLVSLSACAAGGEPSRLVDIAFGRAQPGFQPPRWTPLNKGLDESQRRAVGLALSAKDICLIHGPPGTGKTTTLIELILQEAKRGSRVLVCAASNIAVDNLVERLVRASRKIRAVRMGHPARLLPEVLDSSLEAQVLRSDNSSIARDCRADMKKASAALLKLGRRDYEQRRAIRQELRQLAKEERQRQGGGAGGHRQGAGCLLHPHGASGPGPA